MALILSLFAIFDKSTQCQNNSSFVNQYIDIELNVPSIRSVNAIGSAVMGPKDQ